MNLNKSVQFVLTNTSIFKDSPLAERRQLANLLDTAPELLEMLKSIREVGVCDKAGIDRLIKKAEGK